MDLRMFFSGKMSCEEMASAFLATLLDQRDDIRKNFFEILREAIGHDRVEGLKQKSWDVDVEMDQEDIRLTEVGGSTVLLLRNDLSSSRGPTDIGVPRPAGLRPKKRPIALSLPL